MHRILLLGGLITGMALAASSVHEFSMESIDGRSVALSQYKGKAILFVNVASQCGYTPQYAGLETLYQRYKDRGLVIVGIPANNFGAQEPGTNAEIQQFCSRKYNVTFPMLAKVSVKGADQAPLYGYLTSKEASAATAGDVKWNFTKFLVGRDGRIRERFESRVAPDAPELTAAIENALQ